MELVRKSIPYYDAILDGVTVYEESADAIVPDTYPDIARIVYADGMANIKDESPQNERVLVSGTVAVTVLYQPEGDGGLRRLDVPLSFAHIQEAHGVNNDSTCFVRCSVAGVTARAVNSRKVSVAARLCFESAVYQPNTLEYTEKVDGGEMPLEVLYDTKDITLLCAVDPCEFTVLDDLELSGANDLELLHTGCALRQNECRAMNGRAMLRGEAVLHLLMRDDTGSFQQVTQNVPFTQMLDVEGLTEGAPVSVRLAVRNVDCVLANDGTLSVGLGVDALVMRDEQHRVCTIQDLYQTRHELEVQAATTEAHCCALRGNFAADSMETLPIGMRVSQYIGADAVCTGVQTGADGVQLKAEANILYLDEEGSLYQTHRAFTVPVHANVPLHGLDLHDVSLQAAAAPSGEDGVNLRLSVMGTLTKGESAAIQDVTSVSANPETHASRGDVTLILRSAEDGERLWDIAKQYATTVSSIRGANSLSDDQQTVGAQMLLIPIEQ